MVRMIYSVRACYFSLASVESAEAVGRSCAISFSVSRQASAPHRRASFTKLPIGHSRINLDRGLARLMASTVAPTSALTGFMSATISLGRRRPACGAKPFTPLKLPTTSKSGLAAKRCLTICERALDPTTSTLTFDPFAPLLSDAFWRTDQLGCGNHRWLVLLASCAVSLNGSLTWSIDQKGSGRNWENSLG